MSRWRPLRIKKSKPRPRVNSVGHPQGATTNYKGDKPSSTTNNWLWLGIVIIIGIIVFTLAMDIIPWPLF